MLREVEGLFPTYWSSAWLERGPSVPIPIAMIRLSDRVSAVRLSSAVVDPLLPGLQANLSFAMEAPII